MKKPRVRASVSRARKSGRPPAIDREALLDIAMNLFSEKGFSATTTREITRRARCNLAMISYYFGGKQGIYDAVLKRHFSRMREQFSPEPSEAKGPHPFDTGDWPELRDRDQARLCSALYRAAVYSMGNTTIQKIIQREIMSGGKGIVKAIRENKMGFFGQVRDALSELKRQGKLGARLDVRLGAVSLIGPLVYSCISAPVLREVYGFDDLGEAYLRRLCVHLTQSIFEGWA